MSGACRRVGEDTKLEENFVFGVGKGLLWAVKTQPEDTTLEKNLAVV